MKVLISDSLSPKGVKILGECRDIQVDVKEKLAPEELIKIIGQYDGLLVRSATKVTAHVIEAGTKLVVIGRAGTGVDNIDMKTATKRGILVMNTPEGNTISAAEHTWAMILALSRNIPQANALMKQSVWEKKKFMGTEVRSKNLGVIGLGRIGREVAKRALAFGMEVLAYDPYLSEEQISSWGMRPVQLKELFASADYITAHVPLSQETKNLINKETIAGMKDGVRIINCARGGIINEQDLADAIKSGKVAGAAIDVFEKEPCTDSPLRDIEKVILTPHLGASTEEAQENVAVEIAEQFVSFFRDGIIRNAVNVPSVDKEEMKIIQPYLSLAEKIGRFHGHLIEGGITHIDINYFGDIVGHDIKPISIALVKGLLEVIAGSEVNLVNAFVVANERGIRVTDSKVSGAVDYTNLIAAKVTTEKIERTIAGTIMGKNDLRIVKIDEYDVDVEPVEYVLLYTNKDKPGVIGKVGTLLANNGINIAAMQVARKSAGGSALTLVTVDGDVSEEILGAFKKIPEIMSVKMIRL